jgi:hypothetical protein
MDRFSKNAQMSFFMKIRSVAAELFHADRQTDRQTGMNQIVAFRNFAKASYQDLLHASEITARVLYKHQSFSAI